MNCWGQIYFFFILFIHPQSKADYFLYHSLQRFQNRLFGQKSTGACIIALCEAVIFESVALEFLALLPNDVFVGAVRRRPFQVLTFHGFLIVNTLCA